MIHANTCNRIDRWTKISLEATPNNSIKLLHRQIYRDYRCRFRHLRPCLDNNYLLGNPAAVYGLYFRKTHSSILTSRVMFKSIKYNLIDVERIKIHLYRDIHRVFNHVLFLLRNIQQSKEHRTAKGRSLLLLRKKYNIRFSLKCQPYKKIKKFLQSI